MPVNITMPALSPTMEEGTLAKWHVKEGDRVSAGDVIAEIETDKATMEVEAVDEGTIGRILVEEGAENVKVNAVIAVLLEEGESEADIGDLGGEAPPVEKAPSSEKNAEQEASPAPRPRDTAPEKMPAPSKTQSGNEGPSAGPDRGRIFASPLARRLAGEAGVELSALKGSGPKGRIVKADVEKAKAEGVPQKAAPSAAAAKNATVPAGGMSKDQVLALYEEGSYELVPADGMRKTVAARLSESKQTVPHFYLNIDCRIDALLKAREAINAAARKDKDGTPEYKLSVNDLVLKAWALALQRVPQANATWAGDAILYHKRSDVAVAVAVPGGLFTPVVKSADIKSLREISAEVKDLAARARSKKLAPHEYQGGSSAVSNLGMYGITSFSAVINPPHGTILAVGAGEERVYVEKGEIRTGTFMTVTLSCDHRSVDGALGAELLGAFKTLIETPVMMLA